MGRQVDLRYTPEIIFRLDHSIENGVEMSKMISELNQNSTEE